jgi:Homeodomain-like domain
MEIASARRSNRSRGAAGRFLMTYMQTLISRTRRASEWLGLLRRRLMRRRWIIARSRTAEARLVERAKIVLACLDGKRNDEVSGELGVRANTVGRWRKRFAAR